MTGREDAMPAHGKSRFVRSSALVLLVIALAVAVLVGYRELSVQRDAVERLSRATTSLEEADRLVARIDEAVGAQVRSGLETRVAEAEALIVQANSELDDASARLGDPRAGLQGEDAERAHLLQEAIEARAEMLDYAPSILQALSKAARALPLAESAWARVVGADGLSGQAVREYNKLTRSGVQASSRLNKRAAKELARAREEFLLAESAFPEAGTEVYVSYVDARIALNKLSQRSDSAWLAGDLVRANELIDSYNTGDKRAITQAKELPSSPASVIAQAYDEATAVAREKYYAQRERATQADARLKGM